jgi:crossover junction endodeoxyribonuclease RuvC
MTTSVLVGIDTGAQGAIAFMAPDGTLLGIDDMPVDKVQQGKFLRSRISPSRLLMILHGCTSGHAFIERPEGFPIISRSKLTGQQETRQPSSKNMLSFGEMFGIALCACVASGLAVTEISPGSWKRSMSVPANKNEARRIATLKFPSFASTFMRVKDDGRAEAALLALWGQRQLFGIKPI